LNEINFEQLSELDDEKEETTRFLVKYKIKSNRNTSSKTIQDKVKSITQVNNKAFRMKELNIIETNEKTGKKNFIRFLKENNMTNETELFQPDYELYIATFDSYFSTQ